MQYSLDITASIIDRRIVRLQIGQWEIQSNNQPELILMSEAYFPGRTRTIPKDVVASLNNMTLNITTIVVSPLNGLHYVGTNI